MEGFTGLNVEQAFAAIKRFHDTCNKAENDMISAFNDLFETLEKKWASPVAVDFANRVTKDFTLLYKTFATEYMHVASGATAAGTALAKANGLTFPQDFAVEAGAGNEIGVWYQCEPDINGLVGMDKSTVKIAVDIFERKITRVWVDLEGVSGGIAFYDTAGNLVNTYDRNIEGCIKKCMETCDNIVKDMKGYIETEIDNLMIAEREAAGRMSA